MRHYERCLRSARHCATLRDQAKTELARTRLERESDDWRRLAEAARWRHILERVRVKWKPVHPSDALSTFEARPFFSGSGESA